MSESRVELGVLLAELSKSNRDSDHALAAEIKRIFTAARREIAEQAAQVFVELTKEHHTVEIIALEIRSLSAPGHWRNGVERKTR